MREISKLAIICSHPIQYYAPWFRHLAAQTHLAIKVFYLWDQSRRFDPGFQTHVEWDLPLLEGYDFSFVENVSTVPGTHHFAGLHNPSLFKEVRAYDPDAALIYGYNYRSLYINIVRLRMFGCPILFRGDSHVLFQRKGILEGVKRWSLKVLFQQFSGCLYVGQANKEYFEYLGVGPKKLFFAPHSVDNARFIDASEQARSQASKLRQELGIDSSSTVFLFSGKFEEKKRPLDLLQAWGKVNPQGASLVFVGSGAQEEQLKSAAHQFSHVHFLPFQNQTFMPTVYALSDVVVMPSFGAYETWGLTVNEAMCLSKPCIVSNHVGCAMDLVTPEETGLIFEAGNIDSLAQSLSQFLGEQGASQRMGRNAFERISQYSFEHTTAGLMTALHQILRD